MSAAAGSSGNSGAIGGTTPLAATIMCQSSTSSTTSGPFHHDRARSCAVVRSGGGNRFFRLMASALIGFFQRRVVAVDRPGGEQMALGHGVEQARPVVGNHEPHLDGAVPRADRLRDRMRDARLTGLRRTEDQQVRRRVHVVVGHRQIRLANAERNRPPRAVVGLGSRRIRIQLVQVDALRQHPHLAAPARCAGRRRSALPPRSPDTRLSPLCTPSSRGTPIIRWCFSIDTARPGRLAGISRVMRSICVSFTSPSLNSILVPEIVAHSRLQLGPAGRGDHRVHAELRAPARRGPAPPARGRGTPRRTPANRRSPGTRRRTGRRLPGGSDRRASAGMPPSTRRGCSLNMLSR